MSSDTAETKSVLQDSTDMSSDSGEGAAGSARRWIVTIVLVSVIAWVGYSFPVKTWRIPESMSEIGALSPQADQDMKAAEELSNLWMNSLLKFGMAGLGFGLAGFIYFFDNLGKKAVAAVVTLLSGIAAGVAAGALGLVVRQYFDLDHPIPMISDATRPLFCDSVVFALTSALLVLPIAIMACFHPEKRERHKAPAIPFAGVLTGLVVPLTVGFVFVQTNTAVFPPSSQSALAIPGAEGTGGSDLAGIPFGLIEVWFAVLCLLTILLVVFSGARQKKPVAA